MNAPTVVCCVPKATMATSLSPSWLLPARCGQAGIACSLMAARRCKHPSAIGGEQGSNSKAQKGSAS